MNNQATNQRCFTYAKMDGEKRFGAMDINAGTFVGNLIYCTIVKDTDEVRAKLQHLADINKDIHLQIQLRIKQRIVFATELND